MINVSVQVFFYDKLLIKVNLSVTFENTDL
jgi:hypothetical protein